ncbi:MAG: tail fiber domain-containing protein [Flavobacteriales bacterium]|nr:tail fiber domain-containing protein [Flavobacteriales bacterium]
MTKCNGTANKPGGGSWAVFSDARSKENVIDYKKGLNELLKLRPVSFNYKSEFNWGNKTYVGLIAQEVEKVVPTMVEEKEINGIKDFKEVDPNEINYMLINAIKEQQKMIDDLKKEVELLKNK